MRRCSLLILVALAGCAGQPDIVVEANQTPVTCNREPQVDLITIQDTPPEVVINLENEVMGYWFDPGLYGSLAENLQQMRQNAKQLRAVVRYYRACITDHNDKLTTED